MSMSLDKQLESSGTKFLVFPQPQFLHPHVEPEVVVVSVPPAEIQPGPGDDRMFVIDAVGKLPYSEFTGPPYAGKHNAPLEAGPDGHFIHLEPGTREFACATMYATVRRVLDIWEDYFGRRISWHFETDFERLEMIPLIEWDNAQSGYGFLEFGFGRAANGTIDFSVPYCENFDVLAHELGHSIVFAEVGTPAQPDDPAIDYGGMHESAGDLVAIVSVLHFDGIVTRLLDTTCGNLFTVNELDRVAELSENREIRLAFNSLRMSDVGTEPHDRSLPLTGGIFDILVEAFQKLLVSRGLISEELAAESTPGPHAGTDTDAVQAEFEAAYRGNEAGFKEALLEARDYLGALLAKTWSNLSPDFLTYHGVLRALLRADRDPTVSGGHLQQTIRECFAWRGIGPVPGSLLLRPHTLKECGRGLARRTVDAT